MTMGSRKGSLTSRSSHGSCPAILLSYFLLRLEFRCSCTSTCQRAHPSCLQYHCGFATAMQVRQKEFPLTHSTFFKMYNAIPSSPVVRYKRNHLRISLRFLSAVHPPTGNLYLFSTTSTKTASSRGALDCRAILKVLPIVSPAFMNICDHSYIV